MNTVFSVFIASIFLEYLQEWGIFPNFATSMVLFNRLMIMRKFLLISLMLVLPFVANAVGKKAEKRSVVRIETSVGVIRVALHDDTPKHRDNFLKLVEKGHYDGTLFHRVISDFMIQGGDPDSRNAAPGKLLGAGDVGYTIPAEIQVPYYYHLRGALAAAREGDEVNPEMRSSGCQFYIVWGKKYGSATLKKMRASLEEKGIETTSQMYDDYQQYGGTPHLDGAYTVFGEVIEGLEIVEKIQSVATDPNDRPLEDVVVKHMEVEQRSKDAEAAASKK